MVPGGREGAEQILRAAGAKRGDNNDNHNDDNDNTDNDNNDTYN